MHPVQPSKVQFIVLRAILMLQMVHTLVMETIDLLSRLTSERKIYHFDKGTLVGQTVPWWERVFWDQFVVWCLASIMLIVLWRTLSRLRAHTWSLIGTMLIAVLLYLIWTLRMNYDTEPVRVIQIAILIGVPVGLTFLYRSRHAFNVKSTQYVQMALALISAAIIVLTVGYLRHGTIDWEVPVPFYVDIVASSGFTAPEEKTVVLCWTCYALVAAVVYMIKKYNLRFSTQSAS